MDWQYSIHIATPNTNHWYKTHCIEAAENLADIFCSRRATHATIYLPNGEQILLAAPEKTPANLDTAPPHTDRKGK